MKQWVPHFSERIAGTAPRIDVRSPEDYLKRVIRPTLISASNEGRLTVASNAIAQHVRLDRRSKEMPDTPGASDLVGGNKDFGRKRENAALFTPDGGWLSFSMVLRPHDGGVEVLAYNVERVYESSHRPYWIRFDLSPPGHANDLRGMRSHFHPDNPDIQLPSSIFAPHELIELLLPAPTAAGERKPRSKGEGAEQS